MGRPEPEELAEDALIDARNRAEAFQLFIAFNKSDLDTVWRIPNRSDYKTQEELFEKVTDAVAKRASLSMRLQKIFDAAWRGVG